MTSIFLTPVADVEAETGLSKDLLRKWRERYGFPIPVAGPTGGSCLSREQIARLRLIKRLIDAGMQPAMVVGRSARELDQLAAVLACRVDVPEWSAPTRAAIEALRQHDLAALQAVLAEQRQQLDLPAFVTQVVAPLTIALGEAWSIGMLDVYHEHLCTSYLTHCLTQEIGTRRPQPGMPRILLATPSDEYHALGLLMAQAVLADCGADCIPIGPHVPTGDLLKAASGCAVDVVALSLSFSYPARRLRPLVQQFRAALPPQVELWLGGAGAQQIKEVPAGVCVFADLEQPVAHVQAHWPKASPRP